MNSEEKILEMLTGLTETVSKQGEILTALSKGQEEMRTDIAELKGDVSKLKADVSELKADVSELKTDVSELKTDVSRLKIDVSELKADVKVLDERSLKSAVLLETDVPRDINRLYEAHSEIVTKLNTLATKEQVEELSSDVDVIKRVVSRHSGDISRLKKAL